MSRHPMKYYLCESDEVQDRANTYRAAYLRLRDVLNKVVESFGADKYRACFDSMRLIGIEFRGTPPEGWTKPSRGISWPKQISANAEVLKHFVPRGTHQIKMHPDLASFWSWLTFPGSYRWIDTIGQASGWVSLVQDQDIIWYSEMSPVLLCLPDLEALRTRHAARGETITEGIDWKHPAGLREILEEEWNVMRAQHKLDLAKAGKANS